MPRIGRRRLSANPEVKAEGGHRSLLTRIAEVCGIVAVPVAAFFGWLAWKGPWDIVLADKPAISLSLGKSRLSENAPIAVVVAIPHPVDGNYQTIVSLPLRIANEGEKSIANAALTIRFPAVIHRKQLQEVVTPRLSAMGQLVATVEPKFVSDGQFDYSSYQLKLLDPRVRFTVGEPTYLEDTRFRANFLITQDSGASIISISGTYSIPLLVTTSGTDVIPANYEIVLQSAFAPSLDEAVASVERDVVGSQRRTARDRLSFTQYLYGLLFRNEGRAAYVVYESPADRQVKGEHVRVAEDFQQIGELKYPLLSWDYLFGGPRPDATKPP